MVACKKPKPNKGDDTPKLEEVTFSNMITSMTKGEEFEIVYSTQENVVATFVSSDTNVASVENNKITAINLGNFTITATFTLGEESKTYNFAIEVKGAEYSVTYELNEGTLSNDAPTSYREGEGLVLPIPTKEEYEFLGWSFLHLH